MSSIYLKKLLVALPPPLMAKVLSQDGQHWHKPSLGRPFWGHCHCRESTEVVNDGLCYALYLGSKGYKGYCQILTPGFIMVGFVANHDEHLRLFVFQVDEAWISWCQVVELFPGSPVGHEWVNIALKGKYSVLYHPSRGISSVEAFRCCEQPASFPFTWSGQ